MAINKKLIHFKTKAAFDEQLAAGNILDTSIIWIQDAKLIYTHGTFYADQNNVVNSINGSKGDVQLLIPTKVSQLDNDNDYITTSDVNQALNEKSNKFLTQTVTSSSFVMNPNIRYIANGLTSLQPTFATPTDSTIINEYILQFTASSSGTTLTLPSSIKWMNGEQIIIEAGKTYEISVINNLAIYGSF